jgi:hypothetical protein
MEEKKRASAAADAPMNAKDELLLGSAGFRGFDFCGGIGVLFREAFDAAGGVNELLLAREEGMATGADFDIQLVALNGRTSREIVAAGAVHRDGVIIGMNTGFHEAPFCRVRSARLHDKVTDYSRVARSRGNLQFYAKSQVLPNRG